MGRSNLCLVVSGDLIWRDYRHISLLQRRCCSTGHRAFPLELKTQLLTLSRCSGRLSRDGDTLLGREWKWSDGFDGFFSFALRTTDYVDSDALAV
jgi:hypothetical protein